VFGVASARIFASMLNKRGNTYKRTRGLQQHAVV